MKTPRDILFEKHAAATPALDRARRAAVEQAACLFTPSAQKTRHAPGRSRQDACSTLNGAIKQIIRPATFLFLPRQIWAGLFLPARRVWMGLAFTWVFMLGAGLALTLDTAPSSALMAANFAPPSPEMRRALARQRLELAALIQMDSPEPAEPPRPRPQPRSGARPAILIV